MTDKTAIRAFVTATLGTVLILSAVLYLFLNSPKKQADTGAGEISGLTVTGIISIKGSADNSDAQGKGRPNTDSGENLPERNTDAPGSSSSAEESFTESRENPAAEIIQKQTPVNQVRKNHKAVKSTERPHTMSVRTQKNLEKTAVRDIGTSQNKDTAEKENKETGNGSASAEVAGTGGSSGTAKAHASSDSDMYRKAYGMLVNRARQLHTYPYQARKRGIEGKGLLTVTIDSRGIVTGSSLNKSTGSGILDRAMENLGDKLRGFDTGIRGLELKVNIPLVYRLRNDT